MPGSHPHPGASQTDLDARRLPQRLVAFAAGAQLGTTVITLEAVRHDRVHRLRGAVRMAATRSFTP